MRLAGHCFQHKEEEASKLLMWQPDRGRANRGREERPTLIRYLMIRAAQQHKSFCWYDYIVIMLQYSVLTRASR